MGFFKTWDTLLKDVLGKEIQGYNLKYSSSMLLVVVVAVAVASHATMKIVEEHEVKSNIKSFLSCTPF